MSVNSLSPQKGHVDVLNVNDVENMSPKQNGKPVSPVLSIVKVKPLIDAINTRNGNRDIIERENDMVDTQVRQETEPEVVEPLEEDTSAKSFLDQNASILNAHESNEPSIALQLVFEELGKEDISSVDLPMAVAEEHEQQVTLPPAPPLDHLMSSSSNAQISASTGASSLAQNRPGSSAQSTTSFKITESSAAASGRVVESSRVPDSTTSAHSNSVEILTKKQTTKSKIHSNAEVPKKRSTNSANMVTVTSSAAAKSARASALAAKEAATAERIKKVAELKSKWKEEHELKMNANKSNRQAELNLLKQMSSKASEQRRTKLEQQRQFDDNEKLRHRLALQEKQADQKKQTELLNLRAKDARIKAQQQKQRDMKAIAEAEKLLLAKKKEEEANLLESRRLDHIRLKEAKRLEEEEKRLAAVARGVVAMEQREISSELQHAKKLEEIDRMDIRRQHWEDDRSAKEKQQRSRRESLSGRLDAWRSERAQSAKLQESEQICALELLQDRQNNWQALQAYKLDESTSRRQSLAGRLDSWRAEKKQYTEQQEQQEEARLLERELKDAEIEDIRRHKASIEESRRSSLAQRLEKARIDNDHEQAQEAVRQELEMESRRIATQDQEDVRKNKSMILAARRQSLEYRTQCAVQQQAVKKETDAFAKEIQAQDYELSAKAWQDVKEYQEKCRAKERLSLANKICESRKQQEAAIETHRLALDQLHETMENQRLDWLEVRESRKRENQRARKSIGLRLDSWRKQKLAEAKLSTVLAARADEDARLRELDREAVQSYTKQLELQSLFDKESFIF